ncbi:hypothetical protein Rhopal_002869-T1 [Rhodotorula paludigena]|uniref:HMG box domain-containing protein n=1 Tax=Rhodotorula paludigena TaxID=86838 RepID=A0AAV5GK54_9BASI|nr:hypothetical protein Rhopal_002869-T1 [Rhodotorula paludigena]
MPRNESTVSKKAKAAGPVKKAATRKGKSSSYNAYMNTKLSEIKKADPSLKHSDAFKKAMDAWKAEQKGK